MRPARKPVITRESLEASGFYANAEAGMAKGPALSPMPTSAKEAARVYGEGSPMHCLLHEMCTARIRLDIKTVNPSNGGTGNTKMAGIIKSRRRKKERNLSRLLCEAALRAKPMLKLPVTVSITRVSPGRGLDPMDSLGASFKGIIDGIADALDCADDRDPRIHWQLPFQNRKGRKGEYAVEIVIRAAP